MKHAATVRGDQSGIVMDVYTEEPGLQFYGGNFMQGKNNSKRHKMNSAQHSARTQHFSASPTCPNSQPRAEPGHHIYKTTS
jgi:aldose 1-epimerase